MFGVVFGHCNAPLFGSIQHRLNVMLVKWDLDGPLFSQWHASIVQQDSGSTQSEVMWEAVPVTESQGDDQSHGIVHINVTGPSRSHENGHYGQVGIAI